MDSIKRLREQHKRIAAGIVNGRPHHATMFAAQRSAYGSHSELKGLPAIQMDPLQEYDPASANFGKWKYIPGVTGLGNGPLG